MAFAGLKKQFNKANQFISEKTGVAEGTKFADDYMEMEKKTDLTNELVEELLTRTKEYLQPNPASRAKLMMTSTLGGKTRAHAYPQPEGTLGEIMIKYGQRMGDQSEFGRSLNEMGEAMREMAEVKYALEDNVKQNFLEPLHHLQAKDLKDVMHHRRKLEGRRLDYDCKNRRKVARGSTAGAIGDEDVVAAEKKFEESFNAAAMGMHNLLQNEVEQISQLAALSEALYEYYSQSANILESLTSRLIEMKNEAAQQEHEPFVPKRIHELIVPVGNDELISPAVDRHFASVRSPAATPVNRGPCCQALYDFEAENPAELPFKEGNIIQLVSKVDDNWYEGSFNGKRGIFPVAYVQVLVPLEKK